MTTTPLRSSVQTTGAQTTGAQAHPTPLALSPHMAQTYIEDMLTELAAIARQAGLEEMGDELARTLGGIAKMSLPFST